jgi:hypothetical protein
MKNPLNELPPDLTEEAIADKHVWEVVISGLKGREKKRQMEQFVERYHVLPKIIHGIPSSYSQFEIKGTEAF